MILTFFSAVVKNPPNNLWILAAVLAPIAVVTLIIIIITAVLCRKNKNDFKADSIGNLNPRAKVCMHLCVCVCMCVCTCLRVSACVCVCAPDCRKIYGLVECLSYDFSLLCFICKILNNNIIQSYHLTQRNREVILTQMLCFQMAYRRDAGYFHQVATIFYLPYHLYLSYL